MFYVCFKFDKKIRLIFYPYYVKYVRLKNATFFRYININIPRYLDNRHEGNII